MIKTFAEETVLQLLDSAKEAAGSAYVPYSNFPIGSSVMTAGGDIFMGTNIENVSFGATVCAERTAVFKAVSEGFTDIVAVAVFHDGEDLPYPCGLCLQVIAEFSPNCVIFVSNNEGYESYSLKELLPFKFNTDKLGKY